MAQVKVPAVLAGGGAPSTVEVDGQTVAEVFDNHADEYGPELRDSVVESGDIKEYINVYVDGEQVDDVETTVEPDSQVRVIPAASGGRGP